LESLPSSHCSPGSTTPLPHVLGIVVVVVVVVVLVVVVVVVLVVVVVVLVVVPPPVPPPPPLPPSAWGAPRVERPHPAARASGSARKQRRVERMAGS
jgi:hypothetical protein